MLQIAKGARAVIDVVASLGLLFMSYILLTLGSTRSVVAGPTLRFLKGGIQPFVSCLSLADSEVRFVPRAQR
jgi:hypothetical protein